MTLPMKHLVITLICLVATTVTAAPDNRPGSSQPFTAEAMWSMQRLSSPQVSPDAKQIAFELRSTDFEANKGRTDIWLVAVAGSEPRQLTQDPANDSSPQWRGNSNLLFLSNRSGSNQLWQLDLDRGEPTQLTDLPVDISSFKVSPDGRRIVFSADVFPDCEDLACTATRLEQQKQSQASGKVYQQLMVRHWDSWGDGRRSQLFSLLLAPQMAQPGAAQPGAAQPGAVQPIWLSREPIGDTPSKPFGGAEEYAFTPDSAGIVFTLREANRSEAWSTDLDLYLVPVDGSDTPQLLTGDNPAWDSMPQFSPDGSKLAYLAMERAGYEADRMRLVLRDWPNGKERIVTRDWDRSIDSYVFSADSKSVYATAADVGEVKLFSIDLASGKVSTLVAGGHLRSPQQAGNQLVFGRDDLGHPVELYRSDLTGGEIAQLTHFNKDRLSGLALGEYRQFSFKGWNNDEVWGYLIEPANRRAGETYPLAFIIHGGPQGSSSNDFHYRWNPQVYAGAGYAVAMIDFHGSTGYGQDFTDAIRNDWGGKPLIDLQKGLAAVLKDNPWIDGDRACALGASYGGYMINWIAGNWQGAFNCLVNHDGVFDNRTMYFETEELWFVEWEFGGSYWRNSKGFERHNPVAHVSNWRTPMLVVQGELDFRVPVSQGLAAFTALQRQNIPSKLLYFPDENHWVLNPANGLQWHREVLAWLDQWTAKGPDRGASN